MPLDCARVELMDDWAAAICERGHVAGRVIEVNSFLDEVGKYCQECGASIHGSCPNCFLTLTPLGTQQQIPAFCKQCGLPYPWATREQRVFHVQNVLAKATLD